MSENMEFLWLCAEGRQAKAGIEGEAAVEGAKHPRNL